MIIQNSFILQYYDFKNIDNKVLLTIDSCPTITHGQETLKNLLNAFLFITDNHLNYLDLSTVKFQVIMDNFWTFLHREHIDLSLEFLTNLRGNVGRWIAYLKQIIPLLQKYEINKKKKTFDFKFEQENLNYIQGWFLQGKGNDKQLFINLIVFYNVLGIEKTNLILKNAQQYSSKFELSTSRLFTTMINEFSLFLTTQNQDTLASKLYSEIDLYNLIKDFCFYFFKKEEAQEHALYVSKRKWNKFIESFSEVFLDGNILPKLLKELPRLPVVGMSGFERRIKIENGIEFKSKLITEIPLHITDDVALEILFKKINSDLNLTVEWANTEIEELLNSYNYQFKPILFNKSLKYINKHYNIRLNELQNSLLTTNCLEPFMFLLINEHPQITESFLLNFELYDNNNNLSGYIKLDNNFYLIGYKKRRGADLAEQKILLNEKSSQIIETIIKLTENYRTYLKNQNNDDWRFLFLHGGLNGTVPQRFTKTFVAAPSKFHIKEAERRVKFILDRTNCSIEDAKRFVTNMTMTKLRASKAVTLYLVQNDTKKMAEALGHKEYKPELLSFYLPKQILDFFQSRWIRIFQKGIICEAMKDSENLFKASNFKSMNDFDCFINLHALKNIPDTKKLDDVKLNSNEEIYIGINEDILNVLLSLEKAVELAENEVSAKALYWSKFSSKLQEEIINNKINVQFVKDLEKAKKIINPDIFKEIIYEK